MIKKVGDFKLKRFTESKELKKELNCQIISITKMHYLPGCCVALSWKQRKTKYCYIKLILTKILKKQEEN